MCLNRSTTTIKSLLLVAATFFLITTAIAKETTPIHLSDRREFTLEELFDTVEEQTTCVFAINHSKVDVSRKVHFYREEYTLQNLLDHALLGTGRTFVVHGRYIILISEPPVEEPVVEALIVRDDSDWGLIADPDFMVWKASRSAYPALYDPADPLAIPPYVSPVLPELPKIVLKTNLLHLATTLSPSLGLEIGISERTTLELQGAANFWAKKKGADNNKRLTHWVLRSEFRYWPEERFTGHFFGAHVFYAHYHVSGYNIPLLFKKKYSYDAGHTYGLGVSYGYIWPWNERWGMELTLGVGVAMLNHIKNDHTHLKQEQKVYIGPTKAGITLYYRLK